MAAKVNIDDRAVLRHIKKGTTIPQAAKDLNVHPSTMADAYYRLEPVADPSLVISGNKGQVAAAIVRVRNSGVRWERIALRAGMTVKEAKAIYTAKAKVDADSTYTGRGRHYERKTTSVRASRPNTRGNSRRNTRSKSKTA